MDSATIFLVIMLMLLAGVIFWVVSTHNQLILYRNRFKNAFAQIEVQLTRRYDLIPNLVETAKAYMKHERETLEAVISARNQASNAAKQASAQPEDVMAIQGLVGAEGMLTGAMGRLFAVMENYPDLKANENMMQLTEELTSTENRVAFSRQAYNDAVMIYNTERERFPTNLVADGFHFHTALLLEIEDVQKREAPQVVFA
ncbi:LemA family protein [Candidatus Nitrospira salsa]